MARYMNLCGDEEFFEQWALDTREGDCLLTESEAVAGNWTSTMVRSKTFSATLVYDYGGK